MKAIIVSDLHIGSRHFLFQTFERLLENIPEDFELILNGDIIDNPKAELAPAHQRILDLIEQFSRRRKVVWVLGNHENGYVPETFGKVQFKNLYNLKNKLLVIHGYDFDEIMPRNKAFIKAFKFMHDVRVKLGARPVHVAQYAKKWKMLYKVLRDNVMTNAVNCARQNGYQGVICGHTHFAEDLVHNGIRYINTGAWTETPAYFLEVNEDKIELKTAAEWLNGG